MPALLVHGIWNTGEHFARMRSALEASGAGPVTAIDLVPNDGRAPIASLAEQVNHAAERLATDTGTDRIDLVARRTRNALRRTTGAIARAERLRRLGVLVTPSRCQGLATHSTPLR